MRDTAVTAEVAEQKPKVLSLDEKRDMVRQLLEERGVKAALFGCGKKDGRVMVMFCRDRMTNPAALSSISQTITVVPNKQVIRLYGNDIEPLVDAASNCFGV